MPKHVFKEPFEFEGETFTEIDVDFKKLNGKDFIEIKEAVDMFKDNTNYVPAFDPRYQAHTVAKAAQKPVEFVESLPMNEASDLCTAAMVFLLNSNS